MARLFLFFLSFVLGTPSRISWDCFSWKMQVTPPPSSPPHPPVHTPFPRPARICAAVDYCYKDLKLYFWISACLWHILCQSSLFVCLRGIFNVRNVSSPHVTTKMVRPWVPESGVFKPVTTRSNPKSAVFYRLAMSTPWESFPIDGSDDWFLCCMTRNFETFQNEHRILEVLLLFCF